MTAPYSTWTVRVTSTEPIEFQLTADGVAVNLTGVTSVEIRLERADTLAVTSYLSTDASPKISVTDAANGKVTFSPGASEWVLAAGHYKVYFWVIDGSSKKISYPTGQNFIIRVIAAP